MQIKNNKKINLKGKRIYIKIQKNLKYKKEINDALKNNEFKLYIQPKYKTQTQEICGGEILIRWNKNNKIIYPDKFINKLEKTGLIYKLDIYVLEKICNKLEKWEKENNKKIKISINQSQKFVKYSLYK